MAKIKFPVMALVIIVVLFGVSLVRDLIIKSVITVVATQVTGAKVEIQGFSLGVFKQSVKITGFKMYNPSGFSEGILLDLPKAEVQADLFSLLRGKLHLKLLDVELKEVGLEKNKQGKLNVDSLKVAQQEPKDAKDKKAGKEMAIQIDEMHLFMGRVVSKDYTVGPEPAIQVYDINLKKTYKDIKSVQKLVALILSEPLKQAGIKGAAIYGVAMVAGMAVLPVAVVATFAGKDSIQQNLDIPLAQVYDVSVLVLKKMGKVGKEDRAGGVISAEVNKTSVTIKLKQLSPKTTQITISARKYMLPKPEVANGVMYEISEQIKN